MMIYVIPRVISHYTDIHGGPHSRCGIIELLLKEYQHVAIVVLGNHTRGVPGGTGWYWGAVESQGFFRLFGEHQEPRLVRAIDAISLAISI